VPVASEKLTRAERIVETEKGVAISLYRGTVATNEQIAEFIRKLTAAFPERKSDFFNILTEYVARWTPQRLNDCLNFILTRNCEYLPKINEILGFDKRKDLLTYKQACQVWQRYGKTDKLEIDGKIWWYEI
jgi:hypothetical protein